jgi:hypothetical protein
VPRLPNKGNAKVCQVIDKLAAPWKVSAERDFDIGKGIPEGDQTISQKVDTQEIRVGENFGPGGSLEIERAGNSGLAAGMADVRLIVESRDRVGTEHRNKATKKWDVVNIYWLLVCRLACAESRMARVSPTRNNDPVTRIFSSNR